ncbi:MAG TPA: hypothetical protein VEA80_02515 [Vitreimonas sp.]|nr:hypothetical protein [Vitreimonas sp.]
MTILFLVLFVGGSIAIGSATSALIFSFAMLAILGPVMFWHYSLYRAASDRSAQSVGHSGRRGFLFLLAVVGLCAFLILFLIQMATAQTDPAYPMIEAALPISMLVGNLSYFASIWAAANALTRFEDRTKSAEFHKTLGTFILEAYLPIGIWVIYPRIKRLLAAPSLLQT